VTLALRGDADRSPRAALTAVARGYPLTVVLAILLVFLAVLAIWRKAWSIPRRWTDAHVPMVVKPGAYAQVADDLDRALTDVGFDLEASPAPASMSKPAKWLGAISGRSTNELVPDHMLQLRGPDLDILIYPMDVFISGKEEAVTRARAAIASRLTTSAAHLTVSAEAQAVEDRLTALAHPTDGAPEFDEAAAAAFSDIDEELATIHIPYDEWEVLYRQRLQVERDLRAEAMAGEVVLGAASPGPDGSLKTLAKARHILRQAITAVIDVATDDATVEALDRLAGPQWRVAARAADVAVAAARAAVREHGGEGHPEPGQSEREAADT
jgi:hypothetical protein